MNVNLRSPGVRTGLLAAGFAGLLGLFYVLSGSDAGPAAGSAPATAGSGEVPPSAENVDPAFHMQVMTLMQQVEEAPGDTTRLLSLARFQQDGHQYADAVTSYERLLVLAPAHRQARLDMAYSLAELSRWDDALAALQPLLDTDADDPAALYNVGAIHANQGDYAEARRVWTQVQTQTRDATLAQQAAASLEQLEQVAAGGGLAPAAAAPAGVPSDPGAPAVAGRPVPAGHPPIAGGTAAPAQASGSAPAGAPVEAVPIAGGRAPGAGASARPAPTYHPAVAGQE